jgi:DNA end-binding protein Ku
VSLLSACIFSHGTNVHWHLYARNNPAEADFTLVIRTAKNAFILIDDEELDAIAIDSTRTIEIDSFVPRAQIDERYFESPYYIVPNDQVGQDAFAVIREAMRGKGMVALGRVVLSKRERAIMLQPWERGLMGTTLRYA